MTLHVHRVLETPQQQQPRRIDGIDATVTYPGEARGGYLEEGFDPEAFVIEAVERVLELEARPAIAEHMLRRAREGLEECRRAGEEGGWWSKLLGRAARR